MTKIKFCGLRRPEDVDYANIILPDFIGFILSPRFHRFVPRKTLAELSGRADRRIVRVGVFVDNPVGEVLEILGSGAIDMAQLHGNEDGEFIERVKRESGKPVIKAFKITSKEDVGRAKASPADFVLLDAGTGAGERFDWSLIENVGREFFLAGGITPENAREAAAHKPYAVDVSSGIERDGFKDFGKMKALAEAVRGKDKYLNI